MSSDDHREDPPGEPESLAGAYAPPRRRSGPAGNPWMLGVLVVLALAVLVFVAALAVR